MSQHLASGRWVAEIAASLAPHPLFAALATEARLGIAERCDIVRYQAGSVLMRQGECGSFACIIMEGEIEIFVEISAEPVHLATLGPKQIVGELGLLTEAPRSATAVARTDAVAIRIERDTLLSLAASLPAIGLNLIRELGRRLEPMNPALAYLTHAAMALGRDEYDPAMLGELTDAPGIFAGFAQAFAQMATEIRGKQQRHQEMMAAAAIQQSILPSPLPQHGLSAKVDLHGEMHPAQEIGGDFYDFWMIDDEQLVLTIADVAGRGVPAALYMAVSRTVMRTVASVVDLEARVREANRLLSVENVEGMFVTIFHGVLNLETGVLAYCNAGHNPPYLLRADEIETLKPTGPAFGLDVEMGYRIEERRLAPGDALFLFTDGVTEALNGAGEEFGAERLEAALAGMRGLGAHELVAKALAEIEAFVAGAKQSDDITCLVIRFSPAKFEGGRRT
jgi:serine phosphatase RsbU (regulator of sigma subunit)